MNNNGKITEEILIKVLKEANTIKKVMPYIVRNVFMALREVEYDVSINTQTNDIIYVNEETKEQFSHMQFLELLPVVLDDELKSVLEEEHFKNTGEEIKFQRLSEIKIQEAKDVVRARATKEEFQEIEGLIKDFKNVNKKTMC